MTIFTQIRAYPVIILAPSPSPSLAHLALCQPVCECVEPCVTQLTHLLPGDSASFTHACPSASSHTHAWAPAAAAAAGQLNTGEANCTLSLYTRQEPPVQSGLTRNLSTRYLYSPMHISLCPLIIYLHSWTVNTKSLSPGRTHLVTTAILCTLNGYMHKGPAYSHSGVDYRRHAMGHHHHHQ